MGTDPAQLYLGPKERERFVRLLTDAQHQTITEAAALPARLLEIQEELTRLGRSLDAKRELELERYSLEQEKEEFVDSGGGWVDVCHVTMPWSGKRPTPQGAMISTGVVAEVERREYLLAVEYGGGAYALRGYLSREWESGQEKVGSSGAAIELQAASPADLFDGIEHMAERQSKLDQLGRALSRDDVGSAEWGVRHQSLFEGAFSPLRRGPGNSILIDQDAALAIRLVDEVGNGGVVLNRDSAVINYRDFPEDDDTFTRSPLFVECAAAQPNSTRKACDGKHYRLRDGFGVVDFAAMDLAMAPVDLADEHPAVPESAIVGTIDDPLPAGDASAAITRFCMSAIASADVQAADPVGPDIG